MEADPHRWPAQRSNWQFLPALVFFAWGALIAAALPDSLVALVIGTGWALLVVSSVLLERRTGAWIKVEALVVKGVVRTRRIPWEQVRGALVRHHRPFHQVAVLAMDTGGTLEIKEIRRSTIRKRTNPQLQAFVELVNEHAAANRSSIPSLLDCEPGTVSHDEVLVFRLAWGVRLVCATLAALLLLGAFGCAATSISGRSVEPLRALVLLVPLAAAFYLIGVRRVIRFDVSGIRTANGLIDRRIAWKDVDALIVNRSSRRQGSTVMLLYGGTKALNLTVLVMGHEWSTADRIQAWRDVAPKIRGLRDLAVSNTREPAA